MPKWLVVSLAKQSFVRTITFGEKGIFKTLYARYHQKNKLNSVIEQLLPAAITAFSRLDIRD